LERSLKLEISYSPSDWDFLEKQKFQELEFLSCGEKEFVFSFCSIFQLYFPNASVFFVEKILVDVKFSRNFFLMI